MSSPGGMTPVPVSAIAAAQAGELVEGDVVGEYRIEGELGRGGMGTVYAAVHPLIGKRAAIKVLRPELCTSVEAIERFVLEARSVNQIGHPNIVDVFGFGTLSDGRSYFAMERLTGASLADRIDRGALPRALACHVLERTCRALEAAHGKGIVHRDLKPDNVFLAEVPDELPQVKLLDFGIAKLTTGEDQRAERTRTGVMMGTPLYMAPEQARGYAVDHRVDVYALGVMAFELLTGELPFTADNAMDIVAKHLTEPPRAPTSTGIELDPQLDALVLAMLAKDPDGRPSLREVRIAVARVRAQESGLPADDATPLPRTRPRTAVETAPTAMATTPTAALTVPTAVTLSEPAPRGRGRWIAAAGVGGLVAAVAVFFVVRGGAATTPPAAHDTAPPPGAAHAPAPPEAVHDPAPPRPAAVHDTAPPAAVDDTAPPPPGPVHDTAPPAAEATSDKKHHSKKPVVVAPGETPKVDVKVDVPPEPKVDVKKPDADAVVNPFRKKKPTP